MTGKELLDSNKYVNCSTVSEFCWVNAKNNYSYEFLDQEIEI